MIEAARRLWAGEAPLGQAVWRYAVVYGLLVNLLTSLVALILVARDAPPALTVLAFVAPAPYNLFVVVAVWRSAGRYQGPRGWAELVRLGVIAWMLVLTAL